MLRETVDSNCSFALEASCVKFEVNLDHFGSKLLTMKQKHLVHRSPSGYLF